jgi:hypothetical protein
MENLATATAMRTIGMEPQGRMRFRCVCVNVCACACVQEGVFSVFFMHKQRSDLQERMILHPGEYLCVFLFAGECLCVFLFAQATVRNAGTRDQICRNA